jgi:undecaprenyl diphosphate synthase
MPAEPFHTAPTDGPRHVALIMDGNGRWAEARGLPRAMGHREGVQALKRTVEAAPRFGIRCLTVFGFSTENWSRPADEVSDLMGLVRSYVESDLERLERAGVRVRVPGTSGGSARDIIAIIDRAEASTAHNEKFLLQVAFNYGGGPTSSMRRGAMSRLCWRDKRRGRWMRTAWARACRPRARRRSM